jgi:hypothetical protein
VTQPFVLCDKHPDRRAAFWKSGLRRLAKADVEGLPIHVSSNGMVGQFGQSLREVAATIEEL